MEEELESKLESEINDIMDRVDAILKKIETIDSADSKSPTAKTD